MCITFESPYIHIPTCIRLHNPSRLITPGVPATPQKLPSENSHISTRTLCFYHLLHHAVKSKWSAVLKSNFVRGHIKTGADSELKAWKSTTVVFWFTESWIYFLFHSNPEQRTCPWKYVFTTFFYAIHNMFLNKQIQRKNKNIFHNANFTDNNIFSIIRIRFQKPIQIDLFSYFHKHMYNTSHSALPVSMKPGGGLCIHICQNKRNCSCSRFTQRLY